MPQPALICVVDDDASFRDSMRRLLTAHGYAVVVFKSAGEFLASPQVLATVCLLVDMHMPVMTGLELFQHLVATGNALPTILITAYPEDGVAQRMLAMGVCCFLHKPLEETMLIDCVRRAIAHDKSPGAST